MSIPVRVPSATEDQPRWAVLAVIATVCAASGIALSWWGTYDRHEADEVVSAEEAATDTEARAADTEAATDTEARAADTEAATDTRAATDAEATDTEAATDTASSTDREAAAATDTAPAAPTATDTVADTGSASAAAAARTTTSTPELASASAIAPARGAPLRVVRGRVAYLRCEGVPQRSGPVPCPRDEALESAAWSAIDALAACASPPSRPGEADVVVDFAASSAAPEVRARDTFASDVERLDAAAVIACLAPTLGALRQTMGSSRLVVSFRFAARAP